MSRACLLLLLSLFCDKLLSFRLSFSKSHLNDASAERIKITSASGEVFRIRDDIVDAGKKNCARDQSSVVCLQLEEEWEAAKGGKEGKVSASSRFAVHHLVSMLYAHSGKWLVGQSIRHGNLRPLHEAKEWLVAAGERIAQMGGCGTCALCSCECKVIMKCVLYQHVHTQLV